VVDAQRIRVSADDAEEENTQNKIINRKIPLNFIMPPFEHMIWLICQ
jgi:hypothetical protein